MALRGSGWRRAKNALSSGHGVTKPAVALQDRAGSTGPGALPDESSLGIEAVAPGGLRVDQQRRLRRRSLDGRVDLGQFVPTSLDAQPTGLLAGSQQPGWYTRMLVCGPAVL